MRLWALPLALLAAAPAALADPAPAAADVAWRTLEASPVAVVFAPAGAGDVLRLDAEAVRLEWDHTRQAMAGEVAVGTEEPGTRSRTIGPSGWHADAWQAGPSLFIVPGPRSLLTAEAGTGSVDVAREGCVARKAYFASPRAPACADVAGSVRLRGSGAWTLQGDFSVALWGWQGSFEAQESRGDFWSGSRPTQAAILGVGEVELRQAFLHVANGTLRIESATAMDVFALALSFEGLDPAGPVAGLAVDHVGDRTRVQAAGAVPAAPPRGALPAVPPGWLVGALGAFLGMAPAALAAGRNGRARGHLHLASENLRIANLAAAARHARKAAASRRHRIEADILGAMACLAGGDAPGAQRFLADLHGARRHDEAACNYLHAHMHILRGDADAGQASLEECLRLDDSYRHEIAGNPALAPFLDPTRWPRPA